MKSQLTILWVALQVSLLASAQTDYTSRITNPSFEQDAEGWVHKGMSAQGNSVFSIKEGNKYMEKWTGRGGAVGDGRLAQELRDLPPGNYELTAAAQNIQEDTPTAAQTGAWIFAGNAKTAVTVRDHYTVRFNFVTGAVDIGFEAIGASGNWIAVDDFRLTLVGTDLSAELAAAIEETVAAYGDATGRESQQLKDAIEAARAVAARTDATAEEQAAAIVALQQAVQIYLCANASADNPLDMTDRLVNPSFETGDLTGWTASGMGTQGNSVFSIKQGQFYVERWTGRGAAVGDARLVQTVKDLPAGRYRLHAAAQNIQENTPNAAQTGAWIFAGTHTETVTIRNTYTLEFVLVSDELDLGFEAKGATGNWLAVDNFRLEYISDSFDDVKAEFANLVAKAEALLPLRMNMEARQALQAAIDAAKPLLEQTTTEGWAVAARQLESAYATAIVSQEVFARLATAIADAKEELNASPTVQKEDYQIAIDAAQAVYDNPTTTDAEAEAAITALAEATFAFKVLNGGGTPPTVTTDKRFIRGATWAFGRSNVQGGNIIEEGFCWSEQPDPKVTDHRTTQYLNQVGKIYWLRDLKPATVYYMRAYAINKDYGVGYGDVLKVVTLPKGTVGHWYNNGGDEETNDRINNAINTAMDYYWNNLSSIHGFGISVTYSPGTPTADCSYGGSMRVGANSAYQSPGTIMHEALHGIGVGTHGMWWNGEIRPNGTWKGDRVTEAIRFWDNNTTGELYGDDMHMWPYGCNGAQEDTHSDNLYCMMGILAQALNEDGLPGSGEIGYALPYYSFNHEDGVKYYIKNEDERHGLRTAFLVETNTHQLQWKVMNAEEAAQDDAAAWFLSFTPSNQYYQLKNAASGYYMTYATSIKTAAHATPASTDNFHLMRGRVDVNGHRGYYIIHPESSATPPTLIANNNGMTGTTAWNISNTATTQRWLILTAEEAAALENGDIALALNELQEVLARIRNLAETPHQEMEEGVDERLSQQLAAIEEAAKTCTKGSEVELLIQQARKEGMDFLSKVAATDIEQPFDLTFMLTNPDFDNDVTTGWVSTNGTPGYGEQGAEFYEKTFNFYQELEQMPAGTYELHASAFQRPGSADNVYASYVTGTSTVTTSLYINNKIALIHHICDDRQPTALFDDGGWGSDKRLADGTYIPNCMAGAERYFAQGLYDSRVASEVTSNGSTLRVGIRCTIAPAYYWTMFDHFRLLFFGQNRAPVGIEVSEMDVPQRPQGVYSIQGTLLRKTNNLDGLPAGIYIVGGRKVMKY